MNGNSVFQGKKIVATGKLAGYTRTEIQDKILSLGQRRKRGIQNHGLSHRRRKGRQ